MLAQFFHDRDFLRLQPPIITSSDCEGAGETFSVGSKSSVPASVFSDGQWTADEDSFFRKPKYLTVSSQLHLEAYMQEHPKVWTLSPTFRAERSDTPRHVSEFWMLEVELRTESLEEIMSLVEGMIKSLIRGLKKSAFMEELVIARRFWEKSGIQEVSVDRELLTSRWDALEHGSWPRITYSEAMQLLQDSVRLESSKFLYEPDWTMGLQLEHERYIAAKVGQGKPVFVTDYPLAIKPFYMLPSVASQSQDVGAPKTAACFDLLLPDVSEIVGGSLREHRLQNLNTAMRRSSSDSATGIAKAGETIDNTSPSAAPGHNLDWYVDLRRFGSVPHGGFGFGFDRLLCYLTGIRNIKDVVPWPRHYGRCDC